MNTGQGSVNSKDQKSANKLDFGFLAQLYKGHMGTDIHLRENVDIADQVVIVGRNGERQPVSLQVSALEGFASDSVQAADIEQVLREKRQGNRSSASVSVSNIDHYSKSSRQGVFSHLQPIN